MVTEINPDGKVVVLDSHEIPPSPPTPSSATKGATPSSRKWASISARPDPSDVPPLQDMVTSELYAALEQLSSVYKDTLLYDPNIQLDLGNISLVFVKISVEKSIFNRH